jgi:UDP-glucose-4-epimerase GalE
LRYAFADAPSEQSRRSQNSFKREHMSTILVTGGAGYIGSHVCKALSAKGYLPITYDNLSRGNRWAVRWGPLEEGDIADGGRVRALLEKYDPVALMHFAAYAYVGESMQRPLDYYRNNVADTTVLLQALIDFRLLPVVFSSSCATYGLPERVPIPEDHPQQPINPYGQSKLMVERMLVDLHTAHALRPVALRYFNASGADPDAEIGEAHDPETHLIPLAIAAARKRIAIRIFGTDYETPDGTCIRDYIHVVDIADAHVRAVDYLLGGGQSCALNLANRCGHSVKEVIAATERVAGRSIRAETAPRRPGDPPILVGNADRARDLLGWKPARSELQHQISDAWNWVEKQNQYLSR